MKCVIVFIPSKVLHSIEDSFIYGIVNENVFLKTIHFIIHYQGSKLPDLKTKSSIELIGYVHKDKLSTNIESSLDQLFNYIVIKNCDEEPEIVKLFCKGVFYPVENSRIVIYDESEFSSSELLLSPLDYFKNETEVDYFKAISTSLNDVNNKNIARKLGNSTITLVNSIPFCIAILNFLITCCTKFKIIQKISTLVVHFHVSCNNMKWALEDLHKRKRITLKVGNYLLSYFVDWLFGISVAYYLTHYINFNELYYTLAIYSEEMLQCLIRLVHYLMGSPADLKLNHPLNSVLGRFFLYHIHLWWSFLSVMRPVLEYSFLIFVSTGFLGLSFQIAFLADMLAIASCHVYCIYVYAARLYNLQVTGLASLSRLFIGRKRNPLPGRVDSCPYTTEQLFIGTIAFTVLLFLLPTTLVYYIVFTTIRLMLIFIGGLLTEARYLLQVLPIYVTFLRFCIPKYTSSSIEIKPVVSKTGQLLLYMTPQQSSWWQLTLACIPDPIIKPESVKWGQLLKNLVSGQLIYPL